MRRTTLSNSRSAARPITGSAWPAGGAARPAAAGESVVTLPLRIVAMDCGCRGRGGRTVAAVAAVVRVEPSYGWSSEARRPPGPGRDPAQDREA
ncbi:hypothetical protein GCM10018790_01060 [Kitasatospora xanthocidica]|nr:hypothetical protein GCM10018790_01060 [Kitasatospora xanthocidica]